MTFFTKSKRGCLDPWKKTLRRWWVADDTTPPEAEFNRIDWFRVFPFIFLHLSCGAVFWVGWSWTAVGLAIGLYLVRMFAITAFYHRYFSHRTFTVSRWVQCCMAILGASASQRGPLWWAAHHRHHHQHSDESSDRHSPHQHGFLWSHAGWILTKGNFLTDMNRVKDFARFPELVFLNRYDSMVPLALVLSLFALGHWLQVAVPSLETSGMQLVVWGFCISTTVLFHATSSINSLAHVWGTQRYATKDQSRNNWVLALITLGEGWHNNHHRYMNCARQGFYWWEIDVSYWGLRVLCALGIIGQLKPVPASVYNPQEEKLRS